jgi:hypothetical protein
MESGWQPQAERLLFSRLLDPKSTRVIWNGCEIGAGCLRAAPGPIRVSRKHPEGFGSPALGRAKSSRVAHGRSLPETVPAAKGYTRRASGKVIAQASSLRPAQNSTPTV